MRKTKIVCTLGPSTDSTEVMTALVNEGMNVARFNFSHGSYEEHERRLNMLRDCMKESNHYIATLLDTKGPEIRLRDFETGKVELKKNQRFVLTTRNLIGTHEIVSITYENLPKDVTKGTRILIDDGLVELVVEEVKETDIVCIVVNEGVISNKKGVNVPEVNLSMPYLSEKDKNDILFGIEHDFDFISASFVRCADDVQQIRNLLADNGGEKIQIISKIENRQGLDHIDEIVQASDGIMIARGDLGVEIDLEEVPIVQKMIIKKVYAAGKYVITATQMLDSMMKNPRPTRAETTDVANAIYDGTAFNKFRELVIAQGGNIYLIDNPQDFDSDAFRSADVAIEFTTPATAVDNYYKAFAQGVPVVSGSTGWTARMPEIKALCDEGKATFFWTSNYSLGVNLFFALNKYLGQLMDNFNNYTPSMKEIHHIHKLDHPSGTAITLAEGLIEKVARIDAWTEDENAPSSSLPIYHEREGEVPGTHIIAWDSEVDTITIEHKAKSREGFALGAVVAAEWVNGRKGFLTMDQLMHGLIKNSHLLDIK